MPAINEHERSCPDCQRAIRSYERVIDTSCSCDKCVKRTTETYDLRGGCNNCGATFTVRSRKGDTPPLHVECPDCECRAWSWRR